MMNAFSNTFLVRTLRKYFYIFAFCAITFQCYSADGWPTAGVIHNCPKPCECSINENKHLTAKCGSSGDPLLWTGISYPNVSRFELQKRSVSDGDNKQAWCDVPSNLWHIFPRLSSFDASYCLLSSIPNDTFLHLDDLEEVDLSHNRLNTIDRSSFATNSKLRLVNLCDNPLHLNRNSPTLFVSSSLWELDLSKCNVVAISKHIFTGLPNLKYLTLSSNKIATIGPNVLPNGLLTLNLAYNRITNVPIGELSRLENLKEIDLSSNPINCTCELIGFKENDSSKGLMFVNSIKCAYPARYSGKRLAFLSQYELCGEAGAEVVASPNNADNENLIFNERGRRSVLETDGMIINLWDDNHHDQPNEFIDVRDAHWQKRSAELEQPEGSGEGDDKSNMREESSENDEEETTIIFPNNADVSSSSTSEVTIGQTDLSSSSVSSTVVAMSSSSVSSQLSASIFAKNTNITSNTSLEFTSGQIDTAGAEQVLPSSSIIPEMSSSNEKLSSQPSTNILTEKTDLMSSTSAESASSQVNITAMDQSSSSISPSSSPSSEKTSSQPSTSTLAENTDIMSSTSAESTTGEAAKAKQVSPSSSIITEMSPSSEKTSSQPSTSVLVKNTDIMSSTSAESITEPTDDAGAKQVLLSSSIIPETPSSEITSSQSSTGILTKNIDIMSSTSAESNAGQTDAAKDKLSLSSAPSSSSSEKISSQPSMSIFGENTDITTSISEEIIASQNDTTEIKQSSSSTIGYYSEPEHDKRMASSGSDASSIRYIIPTLLIAIVVLVCLLVYIRQHGCCRKAWSEEVPKSGNGATEMRLLSESNDDPLKPSDHFAKYSNEENKEQMEKLISNSNRDTAIEISPASTNEKAKSNGSVTDDNSSKDPKTSVRVTNENARKKFFQILVKH